MNEDLSKLDLFALLERLEPIPEPPPISLWPQTSGWIGLAVVLVALVAWFLVRWISYRRANAYRRSARAALADAGADPATVTAIVRRTALAAFPRSDVAGLYGDEWLAFLDRSYGGSEFSEGLGRLFANAPYAPEVEDADRLAALATRWVRHHRRSTEGARGAQ